MKTGLRPASRTTAKIMNQSGVSASPEPRRPIISTIMIMPGGHGEEDDAQISERERHRFGRRGEQAQQLRREHPAEDRDRGDDGQEAADRGAQRAAGAVDVAPAERLADQHRRRHAEAEHERHQQEHDEIGVGGRGERLLAEEAADPDRVDRAVQRLQDRRGERRDREGEQGLADRPLGEVALAGPRRHQPSLASARAIFLGVRRLLGMVGPRLLHRLRLGPLDEARIGEAGGEANRAPSRRPRRPWRGAPARRRCRSRLRAEG